MNSALLVLSSMAKTGIFHPLSCKSAGGFAFGSL